MWKMDGALTGRQDNRKLQTCLTRRTGFIEKNVYFDLLKVSDMNTLVDSL